MREHTALPTQEEILAQLQEAKIFSKLDAKDGYWQVPLDEESSYLTTFNTHVGRFRYERLDQLDLTPPTIRCSRKRWHKYLKVYQVTS